MSRNKETEAQRHEAAWLGLFICGVTELLEPLAPRLCHSAAPVPSVHLITTVTTELLTQESGLLYSTLIFIPTLQRSKLRCTEVLDLHK